MGDHETSAERVNRELDELMGELRVALPGVQVLFAFLLTVPFTERFDHLVESTKDVYFAAVSLVAVASVLLIAPTIHHRLSFRRQTKEDRLQTANRFAIAGLLCLSLALGAGVYVAGDAAFAGSWPRWAGVAVVVLALIAWAVVPLHFRRRPAPADGAGSDPGEGVASRPSG